MHCLFYLFWDPRREVFQLPIIDRPLMWYGLLFALGIGLAYKFFEKLLRWNFVLHPHVAFQDVMNFERLLMTLKNHETTDRFALFWKKCPLSLRKKVHEWNLTTGICEDLKDELLQLFNHFIDDQEIRISDIHVSKMTEVKASTLAKKLSYMELSRIVKRLYLENLLSCSLEPFLERTRKYVERVSFTLVMGTLIGARLGHVLFYEDTIFYLKHPLEIFKVWEGGLASHGAVLGILLGLGIFVARERKRSSLCSFIKILDLLALPSLIAAFCIRMGNFMNQEILGKASHMPWAIFFAHPMDGSVAVPRHPAQLYEAFFYLVLFAFLWVKKGSLKEKGQLSGCAIFFIFSFRFLVEFIKEEQSYQTFGHLNMGQYLSVPVFMLGAYLLLSRKRKKAAEKAQGEINP